LSNHAPVLPCERECFCSSLTASVWAVLSHESAPKSGLDRGYESPKTLFIIVEQDQAGEPLACDAAI
jgi:hypothetical protein